MWQEQFYRGERYAGGFVEALARNPAMATLYAALSNMERGSATLLVQSVGMKTLAEKYGPLLALYSSCLEIGHGKVAGAGRRGGGSGMGGTAACAGRRAEEIPARRAGQG